MLAYDSYRLETCREKDDNGFLRVSLCNITKEQVVPYYGREIPNNEELGFLPNKIYYAYRPADELKKGMETFNNLPLLDKHIEDGADKADAKQHRVGSLGDKTKFVAPYLQNSLIVYDQKAIDKIESGEQKELSCAYRYDPIKKEGEFDGQRYDFVMSNIRGNHIALVKEGRAGSDVVVADENSIKKGVEMVKAIFKDESLAEDEKKVEEVKEEEKKEVVKEADKSEDKEEKVVADKEDIEDLKDDVEDSEDEDIAEDEEEVEAKEEVEEVDDKKEEKVAKDKCAKDENSIAMDEMIAMAKEQVKAHFMDMADAVGEVKGIIKVDDMFAFDSADDIYKKALEVSGIDTKGCTDYRGLVKVLKSLQTPVMSMDSKPAELKKEYKGLANIRKA